MKHVRINIPGNIQEKIPVNQDICATLNYRRLINVTVIAGKYTTIYGGKKRKTCTLTNVYTKGCVGDYQRGYRISSALKNALYVYIYYIYI